MERNFLNINRDLLYVKRDLLYVKRDLLKKALVNDGVCVAC